MERIPSEDKLDSAAAASDTKQKDFRNYRTQLNAELRTAVPRKYEKDDFDKECLCMGGPAVLATVVFVSVCSLAWSIVCIVVGAIRNKDCNAQAFLPTWLILQGVLLIMLKVCGALAQRDRKKGQKVKLVVRLVAGLVAVAVVVWLILGNVLVWAAWEPDYAHTWFTYGCDGAVFKVAVASVISQNILLVLGVLVAAIVYLAAARDH